jgi:hypothetical protein
LDKSSPSKLDEAETQEKLLTKKRSIEDEEVNNQNEPLKKANIDVVVSNETDKSLPPLTTTTTILEKKVDIINLKAYFAEKQGERGEQIFMLSITLLGFSIKPLPSSV